MAPSGPARKNGRVVKEYFEAGVQGRKTGITLKEQARDEHGIEAVDGLFSSPEKPARQTVEDDDDESRTEQGQEDEGGEDALDYAPVSNGIPPEAYLIRNGQPRLPPPRARSPIKTNLNSPARRGSLLPPRSSPVRPFDDSPSKQSPRVEKKRKLNFSTEDAVPSVERSPAKGSWQSPQKAPTAVMRPASSKPFNLSGSYRSPIRVKKPQVAREQRTDEEFADNEHARFEYRENVRPNGHYNHEEVEEYDDDPMELVPPNAYKSRPTQNAPRAADRSRDRDINSKRVDRYQSRFDSEERSPERSMPSRTNYKSRPRDFEDEDDAPLQPFMDESDDDDDRYVPTPAKTRPQYRYESIDRYQKPAKQRPSPFEYRDPNTKVVRDGRERSTSQFRDPPPAKSRRGRPPKPKDAGPPPTKKPRTLLSANHESGKASDNRDDLRGPTQSPSEEPQTKRRGPGRPKGAKNKPKEKVLGNVKLEKWETDIGVIVAPVIPYIPDSADGEQLDTIDNEIAYASTAIETREVVNSNFRYAKTLSMPFFGCGLVDIPPGGEKRAKNSRKNHMVFFVHSGKVMVNVAGTKFRISQGGIWQVPRGNFYSIENEFSQPARLFFSQGCEMES